MIISVSAFIRDLSSFMRAKSPFFAFAFAQISAPPLANAATLEFLAADPCNVFSYYLNLTERVTPPIKRDVNVYLYVLFLSLLLRSYSIKALGGERGGSPGRTRADKTHH